MYKKSRLWTPKIQTFVQEQTEIWKKIYKDQNKKTKITEDYNIQKTPTN